MSAPHKYLPLFVAEATEQLGLLGGELVRLEKADAHGELWDSIFRRAHSLKGSAATLGLTPIVEVAHAAESLIGTLKVAQKAPQRAEVDLLLEATDWLGLQVRAAGEQQQLSAVGELAQRLLHAAAAQQPPFAAKPISAKPVSQPPPAAQPKVEADPSLPRLRVAVLLSPQCQARAARALIVQRKLRTLGTLLELSPSPQELQAVKGAVRLSALLASSAQIDAVRAAVLGVPDVLSVDVSSEAVRDLPAPAEAQAAPATSGAPARLLALEPERAAADELRSDATVRVRADSLDQLLDGAGEMLLGIARLRDSARKLPEAHAAAFEAEIDRLRRQARELHGRVMTARLTPFSALTERLPRSVRDLAHRLGKQVELDVQGAEVELDRAAVEALGDPLVHLVRNAVDHGIEAPEERLAQGKPARGRVLLAARRDRDRVVVEIEDDGRGLDAAALRARAVAEGAITAEAAQSLTDAQSLALSFLPGVSTKAEATLVSGRGVGLDAVQRAVEALGGKIALSSTPGKGTRISIKLPLIVSVAQLLLVQVGGEVFGLPMHKVVLTTEYDLSARGGEGFESRSLVVAGQLVRAYGLAKLFGLPSLAPPGPRPFLVMEVDGVRFALSVDRLVGQEEAVLKPLFPPLDRVRGLSGLTVLGNGRPLLVLDPRGLYDLAHESAAPQLKLATVSV